MNNPIVVTSWSISSLLKDILASLGLAPVVSEKHPGVICQLWKFKTVSGQLLVLENRELQDEDAAFRGKKRDQVKPELNTWDQMRTGLDLNEIPTSSVIAKVIDLSKLPEGDLKSHLKIRKLSTIAALGLELPARFESILSQHNFSQIVDSKETYHVLHLGPMSVDLVLHFGLSS